MAQASDALARRANVGRKKGRVGGRRLVAVDVLRAQPQGQAPQDPASPTRGINKDRTLAIMPVGV